LKPLSLKEFRLLLSKGWDLNLNNEKRTRTLGSLPILDSPLGLTDLATVRNEESAIDNAPPINSNSNLNNGSNSDSNSESNSDSNSDSDDDSNNDEPESIQEEIPYDDPRFDPMEGSSYNSIKYFEASLFDSAPTPPTSRLNKLEALPILRPPPDPDPANGKPSPAQGKPSRQSLHSLGRKGVEHGEANAWLPSHQQAVPNPANQAINPKANSLTHLSTSDNTPSCTLLHTKEPSPNYEFTTYTRKKSGFRVVLNKMFKPRNPAKPT
jgi:hypothetical protein